LAERHPAAKNQATRSSDETAQLFATSSPRQQSIENLVEASRESAFCAIPCKVVHYLGETAYVIRGSHG